MNTQKRPFGNRDRFGYALGDTACNLTFSLIGGYMMLFYTQCVGLKTTDWAWIIVVSKVWDAINDVLIGNMVDRTRISKKSKFMPWLFIGSLGTIVFTTMVFAPVTSFSYTGKVAWCLASYCLWSVTYTMVNVPYGSLHSVITEVPRERTSLSTFRSIGAAIGGAFVMALPTFVYTDNALDSNKLFVVAIAFSILAFLVICGMRKLVTERVEYDATPDKINYFATLKSFFTNRAMVGATLASVASVVFYASSVSVVNLVFQYFFNDAGKTTIATVASYAPMALVLPFTGAIVAKIGKRNFIALSGLLSAIACAAMFFLNITPDSKGMVIWIVGLMFANVGNAVFSVVIWAVVADCIEMSFIKTGKHEEGSLYAVYSFFRKLAQGIGQALVAFALGTIGFVEGENAIQPQQFCDNIKNLYIVFLTAGTVIMVLCMRFIYNITKEKEQNFRNQ